MNTSTTGYYIQPIVDS